MTILYKINIMIYSIWHETSDLAHQVISKSFIEVRAASHLNCHRNGSLFGTRRITSCWLIKYAGTSGSVSLFLILQSHVHPLFCLCFGAVAQRSYFLSHVKIRQVKEVRSSYIPAEKDASMFTSSHAGISMRRCHIMQIWAPSFAKWYNW